MISSATSDEALYKMVERVVVLYVEKRGHGWIPAGLQDERELGIWSKNRRSEALDLFGILAINRLSVRSE